MGNLGMAQNQRAKVTQALVFGSIYQRAIWVHMFEPQPFTRVLEVVGSLLVGFQRTKSPEG